MTLDDLYREWAGEAMRYRHDAARRQNTSPFAIRLGRHFCDVDLCANHKMGATMPIVRLARRYVIARDFGELDPSKSDLLWKLTYGD